MRLRSPALRPGLGPNGAPGLSRVSAPPVRAGSSLRTDYGEIRAGGPFWMGREAVHSRGCERRENRGMTLAELLAGVELCKPLPKDAADAAVAGLDYDSRRIERGFVFFAFRGARQDGNRFASEAVAKGAVAVVSEAPRPEGFSAPWIEAEHGRRALAIASARFYNHPDR